MHASCCLNWYVRVALNISCWSSLLIQKIFNKNQNEPMIFFFLGFHDGMNDVCVSICHHIQPSAQQMNDSYVPWQRIDFQNIVASIQQKIPQFIHIVIGTTCEVTTKKKSGPLPSVETFFFALPPLKFNLNSILTANQLNNLYEWF